jgi:hypothetical protein
MYQYKFNGPKPQDTQITDKILPGYRNFVGNPLAGADGCVDWTQNDYVNNVLVAIPAPVAPEPPAPYVPPAPTPDQIKMQLIAAVQSFIDSKAQARGYSSLDSAAKFANQTAIPQFHDEAIAYVAWAAECWAYCYGLLAQVTAGQAQVPTAAELIAGLPPLVLPVSPWYPVVGNMPGNDAG